MSTYAISDLHGYPLDKFLALLKKAGFCADDLLYIIGDVVDRNGDGGVAMLRYIMEQPNYEFILGNHEDMLLRCAFLFDEITDETVGELTAEKLRDYERYVRNGGTVTINNLMKLKNEDPEAFGDLFDFLREAPVLSADSVNGRDFLFVHGGFRDFSPEKKLSQYPVMDLLWARPGINDEFFDGVITVFGHTPTEFYGSEYAGKVLFTSTWINIDVGAAYGAAPALLRLDDLEVIYADEDSFE